MDRRQSRVDTAQLGAVLGLLLGALPYADAAPHADAAARAPASTQPGAQSLPQASAVQAEWRTPSQADVILGDFRFTDGETLHELRLHYRALGAPHHNASGETDNAVLPGTQLATHATRCMNTAEQ